jgi:hypothetical protein
VTSKHGKRIINRIASTPVIPTSRMAIAIEEFLGVS